MKNKKIMNKIIKNNKKSNNKNSVNTNKKIYSTSLNKKGRKIKKKIGFLKLRKKHHKKYDLTKKHKDKKENKEDYKVVESYNLEVDGAKVKIEIRKEKEGFKYCLVIPVINTATEALLKDVRNDLISVSTLNIKELSEKESFENTKKEFMKLTQETLKKRLPKIEEETEKFLTGMLLQEMLGLKRIEFLVNDPNLEEVVIQSAKEYVRVYFKKYGWIETNIKIGSEEETLNYANIIARRVGRQINILSPLLDAHLVSGDRVNAVLYPINSKGNTITIRKFSRDPYTIIDLIKNRTCSSEIAALLWLAIEYEMNILISGGTASGKTSFLNACMPFIPPNHRIISIEDTRELILPDFLYWTPMVTRTPNTEGKGEVAMIQLLINSLRMRPDRIILGEMRKHEEAMVLFEAMHTGHSVYATVHADSAGETILRLTNPPINIPPNLLKAVNLNVVMFRDRKKGIRKVFQVSEFESIGDRTNANVIYRWVPERDKIVKHSEASRIFEDLSRHTGMSQKEINDELKKRQMILEWLIKNNIRGIKEFGEIMNLYYKNEKSLLDLIKKKNRNFINN